MFAVLSERPLDGCAARDALALTLPAIEVEVVDHAAVLRHEAIAEFEHVARAFERGAGGGVALVCRTRLAREFVLPGETCVEFARRLVLAAVAEPEAQTL